MTPREKDNYILILNTVQRIIKFFNRKRDVEVDVDSSMDLSIRFRIG